MLGQHQPWLWQGPLLWPASVSPVLSSDLGLRPFLSRHSPFRQHKTKDKHEIDRMTLTMVRGGSQPREAGWSLWGATVRLGSAAGIRVTASWFSAAGRRLGLLIPTLTPHPVGSPLCVVRGSTCARAELGPVSPSPGGLDLPPLPPPPSSSRRLWSCRTPSPPSSAPCWRGCCRGTSTGDSAAWAEGECLGPGPLS